MINGTAEAVSTPVAAGAKRSASEAAPAPVLGTPGTPVAETPGKRPRGRPKGSKNKNKAGAGASGTAAPNGNGAGAS